MAKGTSSSRLLLGDSLRKSTQESAEGHDTSVGIVTPTRNGKMTPTRKALTPIAEIVSNPLTSDELSCEDSTLSRKTDATTPKQRKKRQNLFPDSENNVDSMEVSVTGSSGKHTGMSPGRSKSSFAGSSKKSPIVARPVQENCQSDTITEESLTPRRRLANIVEIIQQGPSSKNSTKASSEQLTPKSFRSGSRKGMSETEVGTSSRCSSGQLANGTPSSSRTARSLKYGASGAVQSLSAGVPHNRASVTSTLNRQLSMPQLSHQVSGQHFDLVEDPHFWGDHNVQVLIRTRPINKAEMASQGFMRCLRQDSPQTITWLGQPESRFTFDHVAGDIVTQEKMFKVAGLPMVENCMSGYNSCMFAYGQTGSGKTHTMLGDIENIDLLPSENRGMTPRVFEYLFERIRKEEEMRKDENLMFMCRCSFLEIYNEQITDLLEPTSTNLHMREDNRTGVYVENLSEVEVHNVQDVIRLLIQGASNRRVAATNMNRESSRSHSVFTCIVESKWERDSMTNIRFGRLNLIDLAGSERQKSSGAEGERLKEAANINKSLSTLGLVIMILVDVANGKQRHVPYRDSKLTFLLQDSLGGNSKTTIIATVSPSGCNSMETLSTLKFAQRAKLIRNTAVVNEDASGDVKALRLQLQLMKEELDRIRRQSISSIPSALLPVDRSWDAARALGSPTGTNQQLKAMESIVAGALRREKAAEEVTKFRASEIEHLHRMVQQYKEDSQSGKMILRLRGDKIRRLEALSQGLLDVDTHLAEEKNMLCEEIKLLRSQMGCDPELSRFAMENIRLLDQLKSVKEFQEGKEQVMAQEISNLRDKLLEVLEGKIAQDQVRGSLSTSQERVSAVELAAKDREIELLRTEANNYRVELEHYRSELNSVLESNAAMESQANELQALIKQLRGNEGARNQFQNEDKIKLLETQQLKHLQDIMELKTQLEQMESKADSERKRNEHLEAQLQKSLKEAHNFHNLQEPPYNAHALERRSCTEMEKATTQLSQRLTEHESMSVLWLQKESKLRAELEEAQSAMNSILEGQVNEPEELLRSQQETRCLQMKLISSEASRNEEHTLRKQLEQTINDMTAEHSRQIDEAVSKLSEQNLIVEALENQQVLSINEIEKLHKNHEKLLIKLKRRDEKQRLLKRKISQLTWELTKEQELRDVQREMEEGLMLNEEEMAVLETKLENARKELDMARELNATFQVEQELQKIKQRDIDCSRSEAETETTLAISTMHNELMSMEDELVNALQRETAAQEHLNVLREELADALRMVDEMRNENILFNRKYETMMTEKDAELMSLRKGLNVASEKLIDSAQTDQYVTELSLLAPDNTHMLPRESLNAGKASMLLTDEKVLTQIRLSECEAELLAMRDDLTRAEMNLHQAKVRNLELIQAQEALEVANQKYDVEKATLVGTLRELERQYTDSQNALSSLQIQVECAKCREAALLVELEELRLSKASWDAQTEQLKDDLVDMCVKLEHAEVMKHDTFESKESRTRHNTLEYEEDKMAALITEIESLRYSNRNLELEKNEATYVSVKLASSLKEKEKALQETNDALAQLKLELQEAVEANDSHQQHSSGCMSERGELLAKCASLEKCLDVTSPNIRRSEERANSLDLLVQEMYVAEERSSLEIANLNAEVEGMKNRLADKEAECEGLRDENDRLHAALLSAQREGSSAICDLIALKQKTRSEAHESYLPEHEERSNSKALLSRQREVEVYEDEITKLMTMLNQTEERSIMLESKWRREKETLVAERDIARLDANQKGSEAATLARNFEVNRVTLREAEMMVDALVHAKDRAKSDAEGWKLEYERLLISQEVAVKNFYAETLEVLDLTKQQVENTKSHCEKEIEALADNVKQVKSEIMDELRTCFAALKDDVGAEIKLSIDCYADAVEKAEMKNSFLTEKPRVAEKLQQNHDGEVTESLLELSLQAIRQSLAEVSALKWNQTDVCDVNEFDLEISQVVLNSAQVAVSKLQASVAGNDADLLDLHSKLDECHGHTGDIERNHQNSVSELESELAIKVHELDLMRKEIYALNIATANAEVENMVMRDQIEELKTKAAALEAELKVKEAALKALEQELLLSESKRDSMLQEAENNLKEVEIERDSLWSDLLALNKELELAQNADKDAELEQCKARISNLMAAAEGQATAYHHKLKELTSMVEQVKVEDRRFSCGSPSTPQTREKSKSPFKGSGSPFSCMGKGMVHQRTAELNAERSAQERLIQELEILAASRQREIFMLNARLAEAESQTHDVIRELLGVKLEISNFTESQQHSQRLAEDTRRRSVTPEKSERNLAQVSEIEELKVQLNELIEERESWLEDLNRRHAEIVASRISADKMRQRDQELSAENDKLKLENTGYAQRVTELEKDIKKLSGQQNLQQRIHHHAKIKEENTTLRRKTEDLSSKLRRTEILFARVNDELAKYRTAEGKTPFLNVDEEQCLRSKLQEAEDAKIQMAQKIITLYSSIMKAAGLTPNGEEVDYSSVNSALEKMKERIQSLEQELADVKFKSKMNGEKRRLSDLRAAHSPFKAAFSGPQNLFCATPR
ncbi:kinesin-like protein KIN-12F [Physcomitrium patens]|uniref:Kinesin motor domain-containing protein n=1 Tax=Physcomitrium patens TaxID=3218 RepID=A0A2K1JTR3_PHYPA|nr:kinesin-like protein KIN-12E [Physcomitrium patens]XP_024388573.1 kinesin-like protein KIN-12E [Physcomitrium patens]XP_024388574.1 kinesin-like protein KIN-12E [Physcomitrium patens]PNR44919.1 hypothetical protein PHYPA_014689 [Physcomitrium patens]|eukprot:XP_024388572.1 kinesin-like protein KIN-12E [Physcomitrella patens]